MSSPRHRPLPREEPDAERDPGDPTTVRPPKFSADEPISSTYEMLRDSCRVAEAAEPIDDELAIEAEVLRVALDRKSQKPRT
jgi:hypothetical protein